LRFYKVLAFCLCISPALRDHNGHNDNKEHGVSRLYIFRIQVLHYTDLHKPFLNHKLHKISTEGETGRYEQKE